MKVYDKNRIILFLVLIFVFFNCNVALCISDNTILSDTIHLETGTSVKNFLNISELKSHRYWIYLEYNRTYSIEVNPSWNSSEADLYFNFNSSQELIHTVDKVSKGSTEKYEYHCDRAGKYYIEVFSDMSAYYTITVRDITHSKEAFLVLFVIFLVYELWYISSKRKKRKVTETGESWLERFLSNKIVQFISFLGNICSIFGLFITGLILLGVF